MTVWILSVKDREFEALLGVYASVDGAQAAEQAWRASHRGPYDTPDKMPHEWAPPKYADVPWCEACDLTPYIEQYEVKP